MLFRSEGQAWVTFDSVAGTLYVLEGRETLKSSWEPIGYPIQGDGQKTEVAVAAEGKAKYLRLVVAQ